MRDETKNPNDCVLAMVPCTRREAERKGWKVGESFGLPPGDVVDDAMLEEALENFAASVNAANASPSRPAPYVEPDHKLPDGWEYAGRGGKGFEPEDRERYVYRLDGRWHDPGVFLGAVFNNAERHVVRRTRAWLEADNARVQKQLDELRKGMLALARGER